MYEAYGMHVSGSRGCWAVYDNVASNHSVLSYGYRTKREAIQRLRQLAKA